METTQNASNMHKRKLVLTTHAQFYLKAISFNKVGRGSATSRFCIMISPAEGLVSDSTTLSVNHKKQSQQLTCRIHAQSTSPAVFSIENNSHIKACIHPSQVDLPLDCIVMTGTDIRSH